MRLLITGGSGFIGRNLSEYYSRDHVVFAPSHAELDLLDEDSVRGFFRANDIDVVIHSATKPGHRNAPDPTNLVYSNTRMYFNLARNSEHYGKLIFLGSGAVYDLRHYRPRMPEEYFDQHVPADEHGFSKYIAAKHIELSGNAVELRIFGIFGRYEDYAIRFISNAICKTLFDLPVTLGQNRRFDYLYIDDLGPVIDHFIWNQPAHKAYNVTPDESVELYSLAEMVLAVSGKDLPILVGKEGSGPEYTGDNTRLREELPSLAFTRIELAVEALYQWYASNIDRLDRELLLVDK